MLDSYLHKRPQSQHWQLRMMVPVAARPVIGRREFTKSLGVPERKQAEELALPTLMAWKSRVEAALLSKKADKACLIPIRPTEVELEEAALVVGFERASERVDQLIKLKARLGEASYQALRAEFERRHIDSVRRLKGEDYTYWRGHAVRQIQKRGWDLPHGSPQFDEFVHQLARAGTDTFARAVAVIDDDEHTFVPSAPVQAAMKRKDQRARDGERIAQLYDIYEAHRLGEGRKRADTLRQDRKLVDEFASFVGVDRSLRSIQPSDVREWRNLQTSLPITYGKRNEFKGMPLRQIAAIAKERGMKTLDLVTVNKKLSAVSALFSWAKREGYVEENPVTGLFYQVDKQKNARPPFTVEQLNIILRSPLFTGFLRDGKEFKKGNVYTRDWRFWLPLVCLFTGARLGEIAQLRLEDVRQEGDVHFIEIKNEPTKGQATKSGKNRIAPLHSTLIAIGFIDHVHTQRKRATKDGDHRLFPELQTNERDQNGKASRFWRVYLERIGLKEAGDGFGAHSFRHGLADQLRLAGYFDQDIAVVLGHSQKTVTSGYGKLRQGTIGRIAEMIEAVRFEGVDFTNLYKLP